MNKVNVLLLIILSMLIFEIIRTIESRRDPEPVVNIVEPVEVIESPPVEVIAGKHLHSYFWKAVAGERVRDIFNSLWDMGWRFGHPSNKEKSYNEFLKRVKVNNKGLIENDHIIKAATIKFYPKGWNKKHKKIKSPKSGGVWMLARVTVYSPKQYGEGSRNHRGKDVRNEKGLAVPSRTLKDGTVVYIPGVGNRIVDDRIPRRSWKKHYRIAKNRGKNIDIVLDIRYYYNTNGSNRELRKKDLGYKWVKVYKR